nr:MAG TPA: hypothetical protein [Crassvirales sp.]
MSKDLKNTDDLANLLTAPLIESPLYSLFKPTSPYDSVSHRLLRRLFQTSPNE